MKYFAFLAVSMTLIACDPDAPPARDDAGMSDGAMPNDTGGGERECRRGQVDCDGICVTISSNVLHCGSCGTECGAAEVCDSGSCRTSSICPGDQTDCGGCVDTSISTDHCGRCGESCEDGDTCVRGGCTPAECAGETPDRCNDTCTNLQSDSGNCGDCGNECADGQSCSDGACESSCGDRETCDVDGEATCIDTQADAAHCGSCGNACDAGAACMGGSCGCEAGETVCGATCTDVLTDPANCGACGLPCDVGSTCEAGRCTCPTGTEECGGNCVNVQTDVNHCGSCGETCGASQTCVGGTCENSGGCPSGETECDGSCVDLNTSATHCGACDNSCGGGGCNMGVCRPANDLRADAETIAVGDAETTLSGSTEGATADVDMVSCNANGPNVWYTFTLTDQSVVWVDTADSDYDTAIYLTDSTGAPVSEMCNDDCPCGLSTGSEVGALESCMAKRLSAGTYFISVGGYSVTATGNFTLHLQAIAEGDSYLYTQRLDGMGATPTTALIGDSGQIASCGGVATSNSGEDIRWFVSCGETAERTFSVCPEDGGSWERGMSEYDPVVYVRSGQDGMETACDDDDGSAACQPNGGGPRFGSRILGHTAGRGVHGVYIDSRGVGGSGMSYSLAYETPMIEF